MANRVRVACRGMAWNGLTVAVVVALTCGLSSGASEAQSSAPTVNRIQFLGLAEGDSTYYRGDAVLLRVRFTQNVAVDTTNGRPYVDLTVGTTTRRAGFVRSATNRLDFRYVVRAGDVDSDGVSVPANGLTLNGAGVTAASNSAVAANVSHAAAEGGASRKVDGSKYAVPRVSRVRFLNSPASGNTYGYGEKITARVNFDRAVWVSTTGGRPSLALTVGAQTRQAKMVNRSGTHTHLGFSYTVQAGDLAPGGASIAANALSLNGGTIKTGADSVANAVLAHDAVAADLTRKVDGRHGQPPGIAEVAFSGPAPTDSTYYRGDSITVRVGFTAAVAVDTTSGKPQVALTIGTATRLATFTAHSGKTLDFVYVVASTDSDADGVSIGADALTLNSATIKGTGPAAGRDANVTHTSVAASLARTVDGSKYGVPRVSRVRFLNSPASGNTYGYGERITARVVFDRAVWVSTTGGRPSLALTIGAQTRQAKMVNRSGTHTHLGFSYTVQAGDLAPGGASIAANAVSLNGGTIKTGADSVANAVLTHSPVAADSTRRVDGRRGQPPKVDGIAFSGPEPKDSTYYRGDSITVRVGFTDSVVVGTTGGKPQVALTIGTATRQAAFTAHTGKTLNFAYVVATTDADADGVSIATNAVALNGATIRGTGLAAGRDADITHPSVNASLARTVDGSKVRAPVVRSVAFVNSPSEGDTYHYGHKVRVQVVFDRSVVVDTTSGKPRLALTVGAQNRHAAYVPSAASSATLAFAYTVQSADLAADGAGIAANALELNGSTIKAALDSTTAAAIAHDAVAADPARKVDGRPRIVGLEFRKTQFSPPGGVHGFDERIWAWARFDQKLEKRQRAWMSLEVGTDTVQMKSSLRLRNADSAIAFFYIVERDKVDTDGVRVLKGTLTVDGYVRAASDGATAARLDHPEWAADSNWRVNGSLNPPPLPVIRYGDDKPANGNTYTRSERINLTVNFSVPIVVEGTPQLTMNVGTGTRRLAADWHQDNWIRFEYIVQAGDLDEDGISFPANALSLPAAATIRSATDTSVAASLALDSVPSSAAHKVDGRRTGTPKIEGMHFSPWQPTRDSTFTRSEIFSVKVFFDRNVEVDTAGGRPRIALEIGDTTQYATFAHLYYRQPWHMVFRYTVQAADRDTDGMSIAANALELNGAVIEMEGDTISADVSHGPIPADPIRKVDGGRTGAPRLGSMWFNEPSEGDTYLRGEHIVVWVGFDRVASLDPTGGAPQVALRIGDSTRYATAISVVKREEPYHNFRYVVQAGDLDADGISVGANPLSANGGSITAPGDTTTVAELTFPGVAASAAHKVDGSRAGAARVQHMAVWPEPSRDSTFTRDEFFYVTVDFDRDVAVDTTGGRPRIALEIGSETRYATYLHEFTNTPSRQMFSYTVRAGDRDTDGLSIGANALELNGGSIEAPDDTVSADLSHAAVPADSAMKVDGSRTGAPQARLMWFGWPTEADTYLRGERIHATVAFDRVTSVDKSGGVPKLALQVGDSTRYATYSGPHLDRAHHGFVYVVQAGDQDADGISIGANALSANGALITLPGDAATVAVLTHPGLPASAAHKVDGSRAGAARVQHMAVWPEPSRDSTFTRDEFFYVTVDFDRDVAVDTTDGRPRIALEIGNATRYATYLHEFTNTPSRQVFSYTVRAGDRDADGLAVGANALELNGGLIKAPDDTVSADLSHVPVPTNPAMKVDGGRTDAPHARMMWYNLPASGDTYVRGERIWATVAFDRTTVVDTTQGQPRLALQIGDSTRYATYGGSGSTPFQGFWYIVQPQDRDDDGISIEANALSANGALFTAPGSTVPAVLTHPGLPAQPAHKVDGSRTAGDAAPEENRAPEVVSAIGPRTVEVGSPAEVVDLSAHFRDPDGDTLSYFAVSATPQRVGVDVSGNALTIRALAVGQSLVTVRAADPEGAEAEQSFVVTVEPSRADRARILKRSLAALGRAVGAETVEAIGGRLGATDRLGTTAGPDATAGPGATSDAHLRVGGRSLWCVGAAGKRCGLRETAWQAAELLGLRLSRGADSFAAALRAAAKGSYDAGAVRGMASAFGQSAEIGGRGSLGATTGVGLDGGIPDLAASDPSRHDGDDRARWGRLISMDPVSREELLTHSSFRFSPGADAGAPASGWTFWGQASAGGFEGRPEDDLALDGTVRSAYLGADYRFGQGPLVGLALSRTTTSIGFESGLNGTGAVDARLTSLYPYAQWSPREGLSVWGLLGAGRGTAELLEHATPRRFETSIGMAMTAAGVRQRLTGAFAVKADAFAVRTDSDEVKDMAGVAANVQRLRVASELGGRWGLSGASSISTQIELGARFDGGDAETGAGAEAGAGIAWAHDGLGLSVDARGRLLVAHQASSLEDWGASVAIRLQPSREAGGLSFAFEPIWGAATSGMATLWRNGAASASIAGASSSASPLAAAWRAAKRGSSRLRMEVGYGIMLPDGGRVAPFGRWTGDGGSGSGCINVGVRLSVLDAATFDLFGEQVSESTVTTDRRLGLQGAIRFR